MTNFSCYLGLLCVCARNNSALQTRENDYHELATFGLFQVTVLKMSSIATRVESVFQLPTNVTIN
jgi:hypothetical protein